MKTLMTLVLTIFTLTAFATGLKKVDHQNKEIPSEQLPAKGSPEITEAQKVELLNQMEIIKKNKADADRYLEELEKND